MDVGYDSDIPSGRYQRSLDKCHLKDNCHLDTNGYIHYCHLKTICLDNLGLFSR